MKINICFGLLAITYFSGLWAVRSVYIVNNTSEPISVKGPIKALNKTAIPVTIKPGEMVIKDAELEGSLSDTLFVKMLGHATQAIRSYAKKYTKPATALIFVDENNSEKSEQEFELWQTETFVPASVTTPTIF